MVYKQEQIVITHELPLLDRKGDGKLYVNETLIIKQADTIEELCDFIFVKDEYGDYRLYDLRDWKNTDKEYLKESWINGWLKELYYCIKTDKGLIFVAKMNNKGELELL